MTSKVSPTSGLFGWDAAIVVPQGAAESLRGCVWRGVVMAKPTARRRDCSRESRGTPRSGKCRRKKEGGFFGGREDGGADATEGWQS